MSVVVLVTSDEEENLSIFENENDCIFLYISDLRFVAKPTEALAPKMPPKIPDTIEQITIPSKIIK